MTPQLISQDNGTNERAEIVLYLRCKLETRFQQLFNFLFVIASITKAFRHNAECPPKRLSTPLTLRPIFWIDVREWH